MAPFQILPAERGFYDWFEKGAMTARDAARLLANLLADFHDAEGRVLQITELEHQGDFIVHETLNLLSGRSSPPWRPTRSGPSSAPSTT